MVHYDSGVRGIHCQYTSQPLGLHPRRGQRGARHDFAPSYPGLVFPLSPRSGQSSKAHSSDAGAGHGHRTTAVERTDHPHHRTLSGRGVLRAIVEPFAPALAQVCQASTASSAVTTAPWQAL
jgi:hypothetical protein